MAQRIILFGAAGQVGSEIVSLAGTRDVIITGYTHARADISDRQVVHALISSGEPDVVINTAAYTHVDDAEDNRDLAYQVNETGCRVLAEVCSEADVPLLHVSTDYVFDGKSGHSYKEDDETNPLSVYGASKLAGEKAIQMRQHKHIILRSSWVFGAYGANFVYTIARLAATRDKLSVVSDQFGGPTAALSIANTLLDIAAASGDQDFNDWGTYHYCGTPETHWQAFACAIVDQLKAQDVPVACQSITPVTTAEYPVKAIRPRHSTLNCDKIHDVLGIAQPDWRQNLGTVMSSPVFVERLSDMIESSQA